MTTTRRRPSALTAPTSVRLADPAAERSRLAHEQALSELRGAQPTVIRNVKLANNVETPVPHGLGRAPQWVSPGAPIGAVSTGRIDDMGTRTTSGAVVDRSRTVVLRATGYGATITVDVAVL
jgi:hypothetical protein